MKSQRWIVEAQENLPIAVSQHQSTYLHCRVKKSDINDICETRLVCSNTLHMCIVAPQSFLHTLWPTYGTHIIVHEITAYSIKLSLPYLQVVMFGVLNI